MMDFLSLLALASELDQHLLPLIQQHGMWIYLILFLLVFAETGLIITPVLPGDSLLFIAGSLCAAGAMDIYLLTFLITLAAFTGNTVNYHVGAFAGRHVDGWHGRWLNADTLQKSHRFFLRHGAKALLFARFAPVLRTVSPFVAGMSAMPFRRFQIINLAGALLWGAGITVLGYAVANADLIQQNMSTFLLIGVVGTLLPVVFGIVWKISRVSLAMRRKRRT